MTSFRTNGTTIKVTRGTEGPRHDPYGWEEVVVERRGCRFTFHYGLTSWLTLEYYDGEDLIKFRDDRPGHDDEHAKKFVKLTGVNLARMYEWVHRAREYCKKCGVRRCVPLGSGYAGETIYGCAQCGTPLWDDFHPSMIE